MTWLTHIVQRLIRVVQRLIPVYNITHSHRAMPLSCETLPRERYVLLYTWKHTGPCFLHIYIWMIAAITHTYMWNDAFTFCNHSYKYVTLWVMSTSCHDCKTHMTPWHDSVTWLYKTHVTLYDSFHWKCHPARNPSIPETQIPRYRSKLNHNLNMNLTL